ncbi:hypothetical protein [Nitrobacter sp.]|uniref:hypothetical protein n=1 Tax=Nitrobacter sp. TaxID=29420 RepID=UPI003F652075
MERESTCGLSRLRLQPSSERAKRTSPSTSISDKPAGKQSFHPALVFVHPFSTEACRLSTHASLLSAAYFYVFLRMRAAVFSLTPLDFFLRLFVNRPIGNNALNLIVCIGSENFEVTIQSHLLELKFLSTLMLYSAAVEKRALVIARERL